MLTDVVWSRAEGESMSNLICIRWWQLAIVAGSLCAGSMASARQVFNTPNDETLKKIELPDVRVELLEMAALDQLVRSQGR
jgi:hypothetical protein